MSVRADASIGLEVQPVRRNREVLPKHGVRMLPGLHAQGKPEPAVGEDVAL